MDARFSLWVVSSDVRFVCVCCAVDCETTIPNHNINIGLLWAGVYWKRKPKEFKPGSLLKRNSKNYLHKIPRERMRDKESRRWVETTNFMNESLGPHRILVTRNWRIQDAFNQWRRKGRPQFMECGSWWGRVFTCFWTYKDLSIVWFDPVSESQSTSTWRILYISGTCNHR